MTTTTRSTVARLADLAAFAGDPASAPVSSYALGQCGVLLDHITTEYPRVSPYIHLHPLDSGIHVAAEFNGICCEMGIPAVVNLRAYAFVADANANSLYDDMDFDGLWADFDPAAMLTWLQERLL